MLKQGAKYSIAILLVFFFLIKTTDFFDSAVSYLSDVEVKTDSLKFAEKVYLLPYNIESFYFFYEATSGQLLDEQDLTSTSIKFKNITWGSLQLIMETKNGEIKSYNFKPNSVTKEMGLEKCNCPKYFSSKTYISYHFYRFFCVLIFQLIILVIMDFILFRKQSSFTKNIIASIIFVLVSTALVYAPLVRLIL